MIARFWKDLFIFGVTGLCGIIIIFFAAVKVNLWFGFATFGWVVTQWNFSFGVDEKKNG